MVDDPERCIGEHVSFCGCTTRYGHGYVESDKAKFIIRGFDCRLRTFSNQIQLNIESMPGDSGALLVQDDENKAIGLIFVCTYSRNGGLGAPCQKCFFSRGYLL